MRRLSAANFFCSLRPLNRRQLIVSRARGLCPCTPLGHEDKAAICSRTSTMDTTLNNGTTFPLVGLGTYLLNDEAVCKKVVTEALRLGCRLIDTATGYHNEAFIGDVIAKLGELNLKREDVFITTKVGPGDQGKESCRASVLRSLQLLKTPYLDLVLIHWPGKSGLQPDDEKHAVFRRESWEALEQLYEEGKVRAIGVSNYTIRHLEELSKHGKVVPAVNQVEFHPLLYQKQLLDYCKSKSIHLQAYFSLGSARGLSLFSQNPLLQCMADKYSKSIAQILLKWALQHGVSVIPKTSRCEKLIENFDVVNWQIDSADMASIDGLNADQVFSWDPTTIA